jgi:hypothetical protein
LQKVGFADVTVERVAVPRWFGNAAEAIVFHKKSPVAELFVQLAEGDREAGLDRGRP